jgi:DNA-binding CsgD family transcriptional regulator
MKPQESEMAMLPIKQIATTLSPAIGPTAMSVPTAHQWPLSRAARHPARGEFTVPVWDLVSSAERAAARSHMAQLEADIEIARRELHIARADLKRIHETLQSSAGTPFHSIRQSMATGRAAGALDDAAGTASVMRHQACASVASLTIRQRQVLDLVLAGHPSKNIAADLGISQRTVDNHRAAIMRKTGSKSMPALVRTVLAAA